MISVLFVDDEPAIGDSLRRALRPLRDRLAARFATGGHAALAMMQAEPADAIVSDLCMAGMDGAQLLAEVERRFPSTVRIILSGEVDQKTALTAVGPTHLFYSKPCDTADLIQGIMRACRLRAMLTDPRIVEAVPALRALPSPKAVYRELMAALEAPDTAPRRLAELIDQDIGLSAKLLQVANSAFFGSRRRITTAVGAIQLLGSELVRSLVVSRGIARQLAASSSDPRLTQLWSRGVMGAVAARFIAQDLGLQSPAIDEAATAGLLHDVGQLVLATQLADADAEIGRESVETGVARRLVERRRLGVTHAEIGAYLLTLWGLPDAIVEPVALHHEPAAIDEPSVSALTAVHAASAIVASHDGERLDVDEAYLANLDLLDRLPGWQTSLAERFARSGT